MQDQLCGGCAPGNLLIADAYDSTQTQSAELRLYLPTSMLQSPGTVTITGSAAPSQGSFGEVIVSDGNGGSWYFRLRTATVQIGSSSITPGQPLALKITNATFDWVPPQPTSGAQTATIDDADLSVPTLGSGGGPTP